ncbi:MAG TPA: helix-turn-helix domain-containing protein [Acidimicrobiia bacterium]|nr:helix-turn-helix domain-containing protein [Acidimicrobiia bacterium]
MVGKTRVLLDRPTRRAAILRAAADAFAERGFAATSMDDVAGCAKISRLILYRHFDTKETLYAAVLQDVRDRLAAAGAAGGASGESVAVRSLLSVGRDNPAGVTLLLRHAAREPQFASYADEFREQVITYAEQLMRLARAPAPVRTRWAAETLVSFVFDALLHWLEDGDAAHDDEFLARVDASLPALVAAWSRTERSAPDPVANPTR